MIDADGGKHGRNCIDDGEIPSICSQIGIIGRNRGILFGLTMLDGPFFGLSDPLSIAYI